MKDKKIQAIIPVRIIAYILFLSPVVAFCTSVRANSLDNIPNAELRNYSLAEIERGSPSLHITSRVLYREALDILASGDWEEARERLILSAALSGDYAEPMFTLARVELMHAHPDFAFHLVEGFKRLSTGYRNQAFLAANLGLMAVFTMVLSLFLILGALAMKYWPFFDHRLRESWSKRFAFPPARLAGPLIVAALLIVRAGIAVYTAILLVFLWSYISKREKVVVTCLVALTAAASFASGYSNIVVPALDGGSVTRRLSMINMSGADRELLDSVETIEDPSFEAEKEFALGTLKYRMGDYEGARNHLLSSVGLRGDFAPAYLNLGNVYFMLSDYNRALAGYQNVVGIDSTAATPWFNIGQAYINKMLFAQSSSALKKSSENGLEKYRKNHPVVTLRDHPVYDEGFSSAELWSIARKESGKGGDLLINRALAPWLLFPFDRYAWLLVLSLAVAAVIGRIFPPAFNVSKCGNCGTAACPDCADTHTGIILCPDCAKVITGLSSVKVMEALLRHRRQKVSGGNGAGNKLRMLLYPGAAWIIAGRTLRGLFAIGTGVSAALCLAWSGFYFKDAFEAPGSGSVWKIAVPCAVLAWLILLSLRIKPAQEQKNFRVLPADYVPEQPEDAGKGDKTPAIPEPKTNEERFETFLDSL